MADSDDDQPESGPFVRPRTYGHPFMSTATDEQLSRIASTAMDCLGYSQQCCDERELFWRECSKHLDTDIKKYVVVGSTGEGLSPFCHSDIDGIGIHSLVVCVDDSSYQLSIDLNMKHSFVHQMNTHDAPPGYAYLYDISKKDQHTVEVLPSALYHPHKTLDDGPSHRFTDDSKGIFNYTSGPANTLHTILYSFDSVLAWKCVCPSITESFRTRERPHEWPSADLIDEVVQLDGHVVPVGCKTEDKSEWQWRICYTLGEKRLIGALPLPVKKLYVILKEINKAELSMFKEITSYVLKNVVLWVTELSPDSLFADENIVKLVMTSLSTLRNSIISGRLPSYMIPGRNLFAGSKCSGPLKEQCHSALTELLMKGGAVLQDCPQIWEEMQSLTRDGNAEKKCRQFSCTQTLVVDTVRFIISAHHEVGFAEVIPIVSQWDSVFHFNEANSMSRLCKTLFNKDLTSVGIANIVDWLISLFDLSVDSAQPQSGDERASEECDDARRPCDSTRASRIRDPENIHNSLFNMLMNVLPITECSERGVRNFLIDIFQKLEEGNIKEYPSEASRIRAALQPLLPSLVNTLPQLVARDNCLLETSSVFVINSRTSASNSMLIGPVASRQVAHTVRPVGNVARDTQTVRPVGGSGQSTSCSGNTDSQAGGGSGQSTSRSSSILAIKSGVVGGGRTLACAVERANTSRCCVLL